MGRAVSRDLHDRLGELHPDRVLVDAKDVLLCPTRKFHFRHSRIQALHLHHRLDEESASTTSGIDDYVFPLEFHQTDARLNHRLWGEVLALALFEGFTSEYLKSHGNGGESKVDQAETREFVDAPGDGVIAELQR